MAGTDTGAWATKVQGYAAVYAAAAREVAAMASPLLEDENGSFSVSVSAEVGSGGGSSSSSSPVNPTRKAYSLALLETFRY